MIDLGSDKVVVKLDLSTRSKFCAISEGIDVVNEDPLQETVILSLFQDMAAFLLPSEVKEPKVLNPIWLPSGFL